MSNAVQRYTDEQGREVVYGYSDEISVVSLETLEEWREAKKRRELTKSPQRLFIRCYHDSIKELSDSLSITDLGALMKIIPYVKLSSGGRLYREGERMTSTHISKVIRKSKRTTEMIIGRLVERGVLTTEKDGKYLYYNVSDEYHSIGKHAKDSYFTKVYQVKTRTDIDNLSIQAAGLLYKIIPYFNYEWCCLCENPDEVNIENIRFLSHRQIGELLNVNRKFIDRYTKELIRFGFIAKHVVYEAELYVINPDVMYRKKDEYTAYAESLRALFGLGERCSEQMTSITMTELPF